MAEEQGAMEFDEDAPLALELKQKMKVMSKKKTSHAPPNKPPEAANDSQLHEDSQKIVVSEFDYSVDNHFKAVDTIVKLCGHPTAAKADDAEMKRISNSITFLREWRDFKYASRTVQFACQNNSKEKDVIGGVTLSQFSAASVPKMETQDASEAGVGSSKDFVMYVGGSVWGLDWCPCVDPSSENPIKSQFVAVAAHPPESSYHKIGAPLSGRGAIQIWCLLSDSGKVDGKKKSRQCSQKSSQKSGKPKGRPRKKPLTDSMDIDGKGAQPLAIGHPTSSTKSGRPRGRPRKKQPGDSVENIDIDGQGVQRLAIDLTSPPKSGRPRGRPRKKQLTDSIENMDTDGQGGRPLATDITSLPKSGRPRGRSRKEHVVDSVENMDTDGQGVQPLPNDYPTSSPRSRISDGTTQSASNRSRGEESTTTHKESNETEHAKAETEDQVQNNGLHNLRKHEREESTIVNPSAASVSYENTTCTGSGDANTCKNVIPTDVALPRMMLCLAHNGKVAWDVKWKPVNARDPVSMHIMGYLAVLLGNGSLEVWEVPHPRSVKLVYPSREESIDPRFIKLKPVFKCSKLKCGDRQSIPLTLEWSRASPHDMILAGCHDGVVALWKFSVTDSLTETRPLLSFSAETGPIRTLAWAPVQSDLENANIIVTASHKGYKFWDIRDPFRPMWDHGILGSTYSLYWLPDPRCVFGSLDDGTLVLINLDKMSQDIPFAGKPQAAVSKLGVHSFSCSSFSIWSVEASRLTGTVAYCGEEGTTFCFKPTDRSVRDPSRNRVHHFLCGSLLEEESGVVVATPSTKFRERFPNLKRSGVPKGQMVICSEDKQAQKSKESRKDEAIEVFPPKNVSMHRVSWSVNEGSEEWLCYGGAAGLLRCQEVDFF